MTQRKYTASQLDITGYNQVPQLIQNANVCRLSTKEVLCCLCELKTRCDGSLSPHMILCG